jgi:ubiquinone/menaquinone biosynthesis C-methylase UbiE
MADYTRWEHVYRENAPEELPWELGRPRDFLVDAIEKGKVAPKGNALDICSGLGTNTIYLAKSGFRTSGLEISRTAVRKAMKKARDEGVDVDFRQGSVLELPFGDSLFDFVLDVGCFHHIDPDDRERFLSELDRVMKPGGQYLQLAFSDVNPSGTVARRFSRKDIESIFSPRFEIVEIRTTDSLEGTGNTLSFNISRMRKKEPL